MDSLNLLSKFTFRRGINAGKVLAGYCYSKWTKKPHQWGSPISIAIEPTTSCNLRCPECPSGLRSFSRPTGMLDENFFQKTIDELHKEIFYLTFYFQGEPYLNPKFLEMVQYASQKNIYTSTSTNAHYLDDENAKATVESGLDRLIISIDGTTQKSYQSYRIGGDLQKVTDGTKKILKWKKELKSKTPHVVFQFVVFRQNEHEVEEIKKLGKKLGIDEVKIKSAQIYDYEKGNERIPIKEEFARYKKREDGTYLPPNGRNEGGLASCWRMWHSCVITWDGKIVPCCFDKDAKHLLGNLNEKTFKEIWFNGSYTKFRSALLKSRKEIDICQNCSEGTKVWL
ncbi:MAG: SPASM domain-containing protein [Bacteroidetes bacterium]|nr:SPASM domain-containing protein [Bacteroidota bacterium]